jgi:hypothetical protein
MKAYLIQNKRGKKFWTAQMPVEEQLEDEEVISEATIEEKFVSELPAEDKNYLILELAQMVRLDNVEEKLADAKNRKTRKARKSIK